MLIMFPPKRRSPRLLSAMFFLPFSVPPERFRQQSSCCSLSPSTDNTPLVISAQRHCSYVWIWWLRYCRILPFHTGGHNLIRGTNYGKHSFLKNIQRGHFQSGTLTYLTWPTLKNGLHRTGFSDTDSTRYYSCWQLWTSPHQAWSYDRHLARGSTRGHHCIIP